MTPSSSLTSPRGGSVEPSLSVAAGAGVPSPRPPTFGRSQSLRAPSRPATLGLRHSTASLSYPAPAPAPASYSSLSSCSPPALARGVASGMTPPTRDRERRGPVIHEAQVNHPDYLVLAPFLFSYRACRGSR